MAWAEADWTIDRATKVIDYVGADHGVGGETYTTLMEWTRAIQALGDDAEYTPASLDEYDIISDTFESRQTDNYVQLINGWTITDAGIEHIYDGTIEQISDGTRWDGFVNFGNLDVQIQIIQDGAVLADDWWNEGGAGLNPLPASGISHRFMLKTVDAGVDTDNRNLLGTCRRFNFTYSEFQVTGAAPGNNTLALKDAADLNNETAEGTVGAYDKISNDNEGYIGIDVDDEGNDEFYYSSWNIDAGTLPASPVINDLFEYQKWLHRDGSAETLYGLPGELFRGITHQIALSGGAGADWVEPESLSWGSGATAGTGQLLAVDNTTTASSTMLWMQLLTGVVPAANTITGNGGGNATAGTITPRTVSTPFNGVSTGTAIIGSYGMGVDTSDLTDSDKLFDLDNAPVTPPNLVTFSVFGSAAGDRLLVTNDNAGGIDYAQMDLNGLLDQAGTTEVVVTTIPTDTPASGTIRIERDSGLYSLHPYSAHDKIDTFTITSHSFAGDNATDANSVFSAYIDKVAASDPETFQLVYDADRTLFIRNRWGGAAPVKTSEGTAGLNTNGGSATVSRIADE
jgi:hypothetical protein